MSQASVVVARSSPTPTLKVDFSAQQQQDTLSQFLYSVSSEYCEVKGARFGVEINEDFDKDVAFVIGYVGSKNGIELFNPNLSCVAKIDDFIPVSTSSSSPAEWGGCSGSGSGSWSYTNNNGEKKVLEKRCAKDSLFLRVERKKRGFLEVSDLVVKISWETISKILYPSPPSSPSK